ncbi:hypothetical protein [Pedobacter psychroterrae]|uniref:hypothetical protein n=1 Tax=Pedobacter psychroterrae TaxID=2530453 RepID=UPI0013F16698|nr:hypothetical protein [Pedobacter psychroterrae]
MKKIPFLYLCSIFFLLIISCKTTIITPEDDKDDDPNDPAVEYYITYKANGTAITLSEVSGLRGSSVDPRTLTILGSLKDGVNPKFKFYTEESFIGFVPGLNIGCDDYSGISHFVECIDGTGKLYSTVSDSDGMHVFFQEASYKKDGIIKGTFNGRIKAVNGSTLNITEGEFRVKFTN